MLTDLFKNTPPLFLCMKVLILTTSFPAYEGHHRSPYIWRLAKAVKDRNHEVHVVAPYYADSRAKEENWEGVLIHRYQYMWPKSLQLLTRSGGIPANLEKGLFPKSQFPLLCLSYYLKALTWAKRCDVIHAQWALGGYIGARVKQRTHKPLVMTTRGADLQLGLLNIRRREVLQWTLRQCDFITPNNFSHLKDLEAFSFPKEKSKVVHNGIDLEQFTPGDKATARKKLGLDKEKKYVLFVGFLIRRKGVNLLINAFKDIIKNKDANLLIIGEGIDEQEFRDQAQDSPRINFMGAKSQEDVVSYLRASDVFVLPSLSEGRPNVVPEAMATGLPVIATDVDGTGEFIENEKTGILIPANDEEAIKAAIEDLLKNEKKRERLAKAGHAAVLKMGLGWDVCAKNYEEIYKQTVNR